MKNEDSILNELAGIPGERMNTIGEGKNSLESTGQVFDITKPSILTANYDDQEYAHALNSNRPIAIPTKEKENSLMGGGMVTDTVCTDGGEPTLDGLDIMAAGTSTKEKQFILH